MVVALLVEDKVHASVVLDVKVAAMLPVALVLLVAVVLLVTEAVFDTETDGEHVAELD